MKFGQALKSSLAAWLVARVAVAIGFAMSHMIGGSTVDGGTARSLGLLAWDGAWYRSLAEHGYGGVAEEVVRFFPLYPTLAALFGRVMTVPIALVVIANVSALFAGALALTYAHESGVSQRVQRWLPWWFHLFPSASCFVMAYSEPVFMMLSLLWLGLLARQQWMRSGVVGVLVGCTRPLGVLSGIAALDRGEDNRTRFTRSRVFAIATPAIGLIVFLAWVQHTHGDWKLPLSVQSRLRRGSANPIARVIEMVSQVATGHYRDVYNLGFLLLFVCAIVVAARRVPLGWTAYVVVTLVVGLSANNVDSLGRYMFALAPMPIMITVAADRVFSTRAHAHVVALGASFVGLTLISLVTFRGGYIP